MKQLAPGEYEQVANGLYLEFMDEPSPPSGFLVRAPEYFEAATVPRLLYLRLVRR